MRLVIVAVKWNASMYGRRFNKTVTSKRAAFSWDCSSSISRSSSISARVSSSCCGCLTSLDLQLELEPVERAARRAQTVEVRDLAVVVTCVMQRELEGQAGERCSQ